jgi:para-nitrobenzyl esterase
MDRLLDAMREMQGPGPGGGLPLSPVVDGNSLPRDPFNPTAPDLSAEVPLLIGTTETEVTFFANQQLDPIDDADLHARIKTDTSADDATVDELIALYRKGRPGVTNIDLYLIFASDNRFRPGVLTTAERKADAGGAPVYMYYFTWRSPVRNGKLKSMHCMEIPFAFAHVDAAQTMTGNGTDRYPLEARISGAWAAFARSGNPNHDGLPNWPAFNTRERATMFLDKQCKVVNDPNREERLALAALRQRQS